MERNLHRFYYFKNFRTVGPKVEPRKGGRMEEEINQKVVSLAVRTGKLTANVLAKAMKEFLDSQKTKPQKYAKGKQSFKHLMEQNAGATNIEVDKSDIKGFERIARKYHVDFAVKKDKTQDPPKYLVFFKGRDQGAIDMAFREFLKSQEKTKDHKPFKETIKEYKEKAAELNKNRSKHRHHERERHREMSL